MADDKYGGSNTGGAMEQEQRMYIYRKGETVAREVKYNAQEGIFVIGEMNDKPPEVASAPVGTSPLGHFYGTNKQEMAEEDFRRDENITENREPKRENDEHWRKATYLHDKNEERQQETAQIKDRDEEKKEVSSEDEKLHPTYQDEADKMAAAMIIAFEKEHGKEHPLSDQGRDNIRQLCSNYAQAQDKLKTDNFSMTDGAEVTKDIIAAKLMEKGLEDKDAARMLWDVNNVYYAQNMQRMAQQTGDYKYLAGRPHESGAVYRDHLLDPQKQNAIRDRAYAQMQAPAAQAESRYKERQMQKTDRQKSRQITAEKRKELAQQQAVKQAPVLQRNRDDNR